MTEEKKQSKRSRAPLKRKRRNVLLVLGANLFLMAAILICGGLLFLRWQREKNRPDLSLIQAPDWYTQDFLKRNPYSRPGMKRRAVNDIVVHYVANPGTSAKQNREYFNNLAEQSGEGATSASSHYIIGIDGEILQCISLDEVAYANYPRNDDTVSIECCHPDSSGKFSEATEESLVKLTAWLCGELKLNEKDVIRHYDVSGKSCPKYYVEHEDAWKDLRKEIRSALREE